MNGMCYVQHDGKEKLIVTGPIARADLRSPAAVGSSTAGRSLDDLRSVASGRKHNVLIYELGAQDGLSSAATTAASSSSKSSSSAIRTIDWGRYPDDKDIHGDGVAVDRYGHLFIYDRNAYCLHEVSLSDYTYTGSLRLGGFWTGPENIGVGRVGKIAWCEALGSVLVFYGKGTICELATIVVNSS